MAVVAAPAWAADEEQTAPPEEVESVGDIIVTAQRREQTLFEVPQAISVVTAKTLERQQSTTFLDYAAQVPGFTVTQANAGESRLILRGVNTGSVGSTVAVYVDDVPFGSSGSLSNGGVLAGDFDTFDLERVEVLRGPQGTLYGANALGGVLKYVTAKPNLDGIEAAGRVGIENTKGAGSALLATGMVNLPLGDTLAFRASGYYRERPGFVDAVGRNAAGIDDSRSFGGRASLLFQPSEDFSVRLFALVQNIEVDSASTFAVNPRTGLPVNPVTGVRTAQPQRYERRAELNTVDYRMYSGNIDWNLGFATLSSVTSYSTQDQRQVSDLSTNAARGLANLIYAGTAPGTVGLAFRNDVKLEKFTQEVRLASAPSDTFEWQIGGYYTTEETRLDQEFLPFNLATGALIPPAGTFGPFIFSRFVIAGITADYEEIAAFGSATFHLSDRFEITAGGRNGSPQAGSSSEGVFTWSIAPRLELSDNVSIYARAAKGYRPGGPNFVPPGAGTSFPTQFNSDTIVSYEAGVRAQTTDRSFSIDAAVFYLDWDDILIASTVTVDGTPVGVNSNGQRARSKGFEMTATLRPTDGLTVTANGAFTDAELRDDTVPSSGGLNLTGGLSGDQLPYSPRWRSNLSADYEWAIGDNALAYVGGSVNLMGDQKGGFNAAYRGAFGGQVPIDGYTTVDLRAGVDVGNFSLSLYARNLFDTYGLVSAEGFPFAVPADIGGSGVQVMNGAIIRPRTLGATLGFQF
jgi:outer membrane receptor protein involved in Fe transport